MPDVNPRNAERWVQSYFDSPHTVHLSFGALAAVVMWIVGALEMAFSQPPTWVYVASALAVSGLTYTVDMSVTTLYDRYVSDG